MWLYGKVHTTQHKQNYHKISYYVLCFCIFWIKFISTNSHSICTHRLCDDISLTFNKWIFSFYPNWLSTFFHTPQSSDAIPLSVPWQWAAYGAGHRRNINGVWLAWATLLFISHFPNVSLWERTCPTLDWLKHPVAMLCEYSLHISWALPKPVAVGNGGAREIKWHRGREEK